MFESQGRSAEYSREFASWLAEYFNPLDGGSWADQFHALMAYDGL